MENSDTVEQDKTEAEVKVGWRASRVVICDLKGANWVKLKNGNILINYGYISD